MTRMAGQGWQGGRMSQRGWQGRRMAGHGAALGERSRLPVHSSCQRCCLHPPSPSLFLMAQMVLTLSWAFFSIINSCLQVGRHFFPFGRAIKLSSARCAFLKPSRIYPPTAVCCFYQALLKHWAAPPFLPPLLLPGGKIRRDCRRRRPQPAPAGELTNPAKAIQKRCPGRGEDGGAPSLHREPLNPPAPSFVRLSRVLPAQRPLVPPVISMLQLGRVFPGEAVAHRKPGGCWGLLWWVPCPTGIRGGRNPKEPWSFSSAWESAGCPRRGGKGSSLQPLQRPTKANWNVMGRPLLFGELPVEFRGVLLSGAAALKAGRFWDAQLWGLRMVSITSWCSRNVTMDRRVLSGLCRQCRPTSPHLDLCQSVTRASLTVGSAGAVLPYGYQMVDVKKTEEKKPIRKFPPTVTTMPVLPPLLILVHALNSIHQPGVSQHCQSKQDLAVMLSALTLLPPPLCCLKAWGSFFFFFSLALQTLSFPASRTSLLLGQGAGVCTLVL